MIQLLNYILQYALLFIVIVMGVFTVAMFFVLCCGLQMSADRRQREKDELIASIRKIERKVS